MNINSYSVRYNDLSSRFRENYNNNEISTELFDLLYELQELEQTKENKEIQCHIYALLEHWQKAYNLLLEIVDSNDKKATSKLFVFSQKAKTHKDTFGLKDIREARKIKEVVHLSIDDFSLKNDLAHLYYVNCDKVVVFNKYCSGNRFMIKASAILTVDDKQELIKYIYWLADLRTSLINFYNSENNKYLLLLEAKADSDWYDTLEVYSVTIHYSSAREIETTISIGDQVSLDHIVDLELYNKEFVDLNIDG
ncbi:hypothetical protein LNQ81_13975 [Myroides sp. M-43]|uniref:hypothetical protein n=1 Tax=Myroides oncorhynchi TaxID=2893756 RepID=UPI001E33F83B|nr:hypothetical protein [Myroides oncorhynchi]MCC9043783.1 hypothetical protein [Myroides oncorhynchi]